MGHLYHVIFYNLLESIASAGLKPDAGRGIGSRVYDQHRSGAIFLTDAAGVHFWASRAEEWAEGRSDDLLEDGLVPVLLRVPDSVLRSCEDDEVGSDDAGHDAFKCRTRIPPGDIRGVDRHRRQGRVGRDRRLG